MNGRPVTQQLDSAGFFSEVVTCSDGSAGQIVSVLLNTAGHEALAQLGMAGFRKEVTKRFSRRTQSGLEWVVAPRDDQFWPKEALDRPHGVPRVLSHLQEPNSHRLLLDVTPDLCWFKGHFPGQPILAGVAQLHLAVLLARQLFGLTGSPRDISRLKFQHLVTPPRILDLSLQEMAPGQIHFRYTAQSEVHSQGRLAFTGSQR